MKLIEFKVGYKVKRTSWNSNCQTLYYEILFIGKRAAFVKNAGGAETHIYFGDEDDWQLFQEPKKKVTKWLWMDNEGNVITTYNSKGWYSHNIKLKWSEQEFEDE